MSSKVYKLRNGPLFVASQITIWTHAFGYEPMLAWAYRRMF